MIKGGSAAPLDFKEKNQKRRAKRGEKGIEKDSIRFETVTDQVENAVYGFHSYFSTSFS